MQYNELSPTSMPPNDSRDIPFKTQEFGQDGPCHFAGFQPHFCLNMTSQTHKRMKKMKENEKKNENENEKNESAISQNSAVRFV